MLFTSNHNTQRIFSGKECEYLFLALEIKQFLQTFLSYMEYK